ncbi:MAG TPA: ABC transporter substrate-binding protein [Anaerolineales bacterium]|nr:ABC transporter substrate-binding protein [Anaerolineales bacterium]
MNNPKLRHKSIIISVRLFLLAAILIFPLNITSTAQASEIKGVSVKKPAGLITPNTTALPRNETLYFNGYQWGSISGWNPYSSGDNNSLVLSQSANARETVWETPYMYNMLDGQQYPLLAAGPWAWNTAKTAITFSLKTAAHWSDGTPVTADDVAYTWDTNVQYGTNVAGNYQPYIDQVQALDTHTVQVSAKLDGDGHAINPLKVVDFLSSVYVVQKAWTQALEARADYDADTLKNDPAEDFVASGPYKEYFADDTEVVLIRDDAYWGQDASMWGKLPAPKYLAHVIYPDNDTSQAALEAGEVDESQAYNANVQEMWADGQPYATYYPDAPYEVSSSLPTVYYNLDSYGLDQVAVRKAIAIAVDYDAVVATAVTNQSPTFEQVPRSLMNPTPYEQSLYDHSAVASLQWTGKDLAGAEALLDAAGITDTNADGWREYNGVTLQYTATCPNGWSDWMAGIELVAQAARAIGIDVTTNYPEWSDYGSAVTNWPLPSGYDLFMMWSDASGPAEPWGRVDHLMNSVYAQTTNNWNGNWGGYKNSAADDLINAIPTETDSTTLKDDYTQLTQIYLTDVPSFTLMYRPEDFDTVYEGFWTGFPHQGDGYNPPIPPLNLINGYAIAGLYHLSSVYKAYLPLVIR